MIIDGIIAAIAGVIAILGVSALAALAGSAWYLAENAASAQIGEKVFMVKGYECDFGSDEVQSILGSLQWIK